MQHSLTHCVSQPSLLHSRTPSDWESITILHKHPFKASGICLAIHFHLEWLVLSQGLSSTAKLPFVAIMAALTIQALEHHQVNLRLDKIRKYDIMLKYH